MLTPRSLLSLILTLPFSALAPAADEPTLEERLEKLTEELEAARVEAHIPGMSIAIVKDDEIIYARGFGVADLETERPADAETIYAVGSTTKAFTGALIGMLMDEGTATWDDPVTQYLPYFDLQLDTEDADAQCTLRDLLSHRHGFARMGILWIGGNLTREEILTTASGAEPLDGFRENFHYCNVTYLAAGEAAGVAADSSWDELMVERIFEPLGMEASTLRTADAQKDERLSLGYEWNEADEENRHKKMVALDAIGPAGSINSNVLDMAQWLRLQLGKGTVDDMQLITEERILETWAPQVSVGGDVAYGLGWMLREWKDKQVVEHGGNIDGFSAQVGMIPEENLGYVLLMNLDISPLQQSSLGIVFDALLGEWPDADALAEGGEIDYDEHLGVYVANFANFRDEEFEVRRTDDGLALNIPSQQTFDLAQPNEEGRWPFKLTDQIAVSFDRGEDGQIQSLWIHQGGYDFEVPRQGVEVKPEVPAEELEKYTGKYKLAEGDKELEILIARGRLALLDKGQQMDFHTPDKEGHAALRARADQGATFHSDAEGTVTGLTFHGNAGDRLFNKLEDAPDEALPSVEELLALRKADERRAALEAAGGTKATGEIWVAQAGVRGTFTAYARGGDHYANVTDFGKIGEMRSGTAGEDAWTYNPMRGLKILNGAELTQAILGHPAAIEGDWREYYDSVEVVRSESVGDRPAHVVRLKREDFPSRSYWVDAETGDVLKVKYVGFEGSIRIPITITLSDFEDVDGFRVATRIQTENPASGRTVMTFEKFESGLELGDEIFQPAEEASGEPAGTAR